MAITQNITLDDLLDMSISEFEDAISSISKTELSKVEIVLSDYARQTSARNMLENKVALKLNYIKNAKTVKKSLKKVIAKVQEESKQESTQAPKIDKAQKPRNSSLNGISIRSSSNTPKNSGVNYNYQKGQGDFFGKSSAFKFIKQMSDNMQSESSNDNQMGFDFGNKVKKARKPSEKSNIGKLSITHLEPKALKQIRDILMMPEKIARQNSKSNQPKRTVKRATKFEKDNLAFKNKDADIREKHIQAISEKTRTSKELVELKDKVEKNKERRKNRHNEKDLNIKADIAKDKLQHSHDLQVKREEVKLNRKRQSDEVRTELKKLAYKNSRDIAKDKQEIQLQKSQLIRKQQLHRDLHSIHPALGLLYGMNQQKKENSQNGQNGDSGGIMSSILGGLAGGVGAAGVGMMGRGGNAFRGMKAGLGTNTIKGMSKHMGMNALKLGGSRLPIIGAGIAGISEGMESGSVGKGLATFAGALTGSALMGAAAGAVFGPVGAIIGAIVGHSLGMIASKDIFNHLTKDRSGQPSGAGAVFDQNLANRNKNKNVKQVPNPNTPQSASGKVGKVGASGGDFLAKEEGLKLNAYLDGATKSGKDLVSIGRGHQIKDHEYSQGFIQVGQDRIPISGNKGLDTKLTKEQAEALYKIDSEEYSSKARNKLGADAYDKLTEKQKTALNSYAYNVGSIDSLVKHGLRDKIQSGDMQGASDIIRDKGIRTEKGKFNQGLDDRRKREAAMFAEKAPSKIESLQNSTNRVQEKSMEEKSKPLNVINVGGSSGGSSNVTNNTYVNPANTDATPRQLANNMMYPGRLV